MNRSKIAGLVLIALSLTSISACKTKPVTPAYSLQAFPAVGTTSTAEVGEELIEQGDAAIVDALILRNDVTMGDMTFKQGTYPLAVSTDDHQLFNRVNVLRRNKLSSRGKLFLFARNGSSKQLCASRSVCAEADFSLGQTTAFSRARPRQVLVYNGKIADKVTLGYREFIKSAGKATSSNDVSYDLTESTSLSYKGARIEVISATNTDITYRVLAGFDGLQ
ncbi:hypothetical protein QPK31_07460 [Massilia sp. YIM B02769]|uniref:hypothetical protein n=1 Tax=unclassified Massilia TaxID=2609279 RepID=UPI0025B6F138|nr:MULTISPECIES: hypothetical protein [unclassified Massilia]MDN4058066.1 hypothetical protein [Massilia sp. YIM B02769]